MSKTGEWGDKIIIYLHGDGSRRNKTHCKYYRGIDNYCLYCFHSCPGSPQCSYYTEKNTEAKCPENSTVPHKTSVDKKPFVGNMLIDIQDVEVPSGKMETPNQCKINNLVNYYNEHHELDKPIVVSCSGNKYLLEDKYLRYYVAKQLGLKHILATMNIFRPEDFLRRIGAKLWHTKLSEPMTVISATEDRITVQRRNGKPMTLDINDCIKNSTLKIMC